MVVVEEEEEAVDLVKIEKLTALLPSLPTTRVLPFSTVFRRDRQVLIDQGSVS